MSGIRRSFVFILYFYALLSLFYMPPLVAPSLLSADFGNLQRDVKMLNSSEADFLHIDVMDGHFVPNISFGFPVIKSIQETASKPLDMHLMISNPDDYIDRFADLGAAIISIHYEGSVHLHRSIQSIKNRNVKAGIVLNPHTPVHVLEDIINEIDLVLIMSVNPGFGGQCFIENTYKKIRELKYLIQKHNTDCFIEVDGGVNRENASGLVEAGADILVAGNTVFSSANPEKTISDLKHLA